MMTSSYQNLPIVPIGINLLLEQLKEKTLQETNQNERVNHVGGFDGAAPPVMVEKLRPASVDNSKSFILEKNSKNHYRALCLFSGCDHSCDQPTAVQCSHEDH